MSPIILSALFGCGRVARCDLDRAVVVDVDLDAGCFHDATDHLAARSDQVADLVGRNLHRVEARCELADLLCGPARSLVHLVEDVQASALRLRECFAHDLRRDAHHLDVHLQCGNAVRGAGDLEVHVAVMIFRTGDVGEHGVLARLPSPDPWQRPQPERADGTPASIRLSEPPQTVAIDDEPLDSRMSETTRIAYGNVIFIGQHGVERALGECSVTDLATASAAQERHFADRERREVVVQHEALLGLAFEAFEALHVVGGAERGGNQCLRLATGKDRRTVRAWKHAGLDPNVADLVERASIRTALDR